jgi:hypothetical protein
MLVIVRMIVGLRRHRVRLVPSRLSRLGRERKYIASRSACRLSDTQDLVEFWLAASLAIWEGGLFYRRPVPQHHDHPLAPGQHAPFQHLAPDADGGRLGQQEVLEAAGVGRPR